MASRRILKKYVNNLTDLATEMCMAESVFVGRTEEKLEALNNILLQIMNLKADIISRISHTEPGSVKAFYKKLDKDLRIGLSNIFKQLEELAK